MSFTKTILAWISAFVVIFLLSMLWYGVIVSGYNAQQFANVLRGPEDFSMLLIIIGYLVLAFILAALYPRGYKGNGSPISQGLRFGLWMGLLWALPTALIESGSYQFPLGARLLDAAYHIVEFIIAGLVISWVYGHIETATAVPAASASDIGENL